MFSGFYVRLSVSNPLFLKKFKGGQTTAQLFYP